MIIDINNWQKDAAEEFFLLVPSARGFYPYKKLREAVTLLYGEYRFEHAKALAEKLGPYQVANEVAEYLRRADVKILENGQIPYMSLQDYLDSQLLNESRAHAWSVDEIKKFFSSSQLELTAVDVSAIHTLKLDSFWSMHGSVSDLWQQLELFDILCSHRNTHFKLSVRTTRQQQ